MSHPLQMHKVPPIETILSKSSLTTPYTHKNLKMNKATADGVEGHKTCYIEKGC